MATSNNIVPSSITTANKTNVVICGITLNGTSSLTYTNEHALNHITYQQIIKEDKKVVVGLRPALYLEHDQYNIRYNDRGLQPLYNSFFVVYHIVLSTSNFQAQQPIYTWNSQLHNS